MPYTPGEQPVETDMIKLNTNENPYPPSPTVLRTLANMKAEGLRLYPDPKAGSLVHALAVHYRLKDSQVFVGVGSDDVLAMSFLTFFNSNKPILFPDITYSFYDVWAELFRIPYTTVPLDEDFHIDPADYMQENGGIVFPNPNAPTGVNMSLDTIEEITAANPDVVVICDEAYVDFGTESALALTEKFDNLLIVQTFSKARNLAGLRVGYAMGNEELIRCLNNVKYSFNSYTMNRPALELGCAAVADDRYFMECCNKIMKTRKTAEDQLRALGFVFEDSDSNFIFVTHPRVKAKTIFDALRKKHIYVRWFDKPRISNYLRITIGTDEQMNRLYRELKEIV
jgi:histidinol-phosphate aminotransferase